MNEYNKTYIPFFTLLKHFPFFIFSSKSHTPLSLLLPTNHSSPSWQFLLCGFQLRPSSRYSVELESLS
ncbi:unnamed protein product [Lathyrus oleraceus]